MFSQSGLNGETEFDGAVDFGVRKTRLWTGFDATIYQTPAGFSKSAVFPNHGLIMHVGESVTTTCRCGHTPLRQRQMPGDFSVIAPGNPRAWVHDGPSALLVVNLTRPLMRSAAGAMNVSGEATVIRPLFHCKDPLVEHICWALKAELETNEPLGHVYADSLGFALAAHLLRSYGKAAPQSHGAGTPQHRLRRVVDYIRDHLADDLRLVELAGVADVSPSHLKVIFKQWAGMPVHQYVMRSRVEYAAKLLRRGNLTLTAVASLSGFADQSHMSRCMRRVTGISPRSLRAETWPSERRALP